MCALLGHCLWAPWACRTYRGTFGCVLLVSASQHTGSASKTHTHPHAVPSSARDAHPSATAPPYPPKVGYISLPLPAHVHPMRHPTLTHTHAVARPQHQTATTHSAAYTTRARCTRTGNLEPIQRLWLAGRGRCHGSMGVAGPAPNRACHNNESR